jgi:hypothetical protein
MAAIDQVVAHFKDKCELKSFEVPEWGSNGGPLVIYVEPFSLKQQQDVRQTNTKKGEAEGVAYLIGLKALDQSRKRIFWGESMKLLNQADPEVVSRVGLIIWNLARGLEANGKDISSQEEQDEKIETLKKN